MLPTVPQPRVAWTRLGATAAPLLLLLACGEPDQPPVQRIPIGAAPAASVPAIAHASPRGFGSAAAPDPHDPSRLYLLTDRGPNYEAGPDLKVFPNPEFAPTLGHFQLRASPGGDSLLQIAAVPLTDGAGAPLTGLPRPPGPGATGERGVRADGTFLPLHPDGIDPEGLHLLRDGSFWVAEEYGPSLLHFDRSGRLLDARGPGTGASPLPRALAQRRPNRGIEGLAGDPDGRVLYAILQSPLDNPRQAGRRSRLARLMELDPTAGQTRQFLYPLDDPDGMVGDLAWVRDGILLVLEHDGRFPSGSPPARVQRVYRIATAGATDVSDPLDRPTGLLVGDRTLEELDQPALDSTGIRLLAKTLVLDLLAHGYPHDKPEGLVILGPSSIGVVNDDDFGIRIDSAGHPQPKRLPATGEPDRTMLWLFRLDRPLR